MDIELNNGNFCYVFYSDVVKNLGRLVILEMGLRPGREGAGG